MHYDFKTHQTCSTNVSFDINDHIVTNIVFTGGCNGNLKVISKLLDGWTAEQIAEKCRGNQCENRGTSCVDQLAKAVIEALHVLSTAEK